MPIIHVEMLEGRPAEAKRKFAAEATRLTCDCFGVAPEQVRIIFSEMPRGNFSIAGVLRSDILT
ncbi:MAG: tautomerase family protein [Synergistaceae bacterium]|nr:tautomerase family protein [Synergistaceae bacterium]